MLIAKGTPRAALIGGIAAALIIGLSFALRAAPQLTADLVAPQPLPPPAAETGTPAPAAPASIDTIITGSIAPATSTAAPVAPEGSPAFAAVLGQIQAQDFAGAYAAATAMPDPIERHTGQWAAIYYGNGAIPYSTVQAFMAEAPDFVIPGVFKTRIEQALITANAPGNVLIKTLGTTMPNTLDAEIALAQAYVTQGDKARAHTLAHALWVYGATDSDSEAKVLAALGSILTPTDHWDRAQQLMMADRATAVTRLFKFMTAGQKSLALARNAVSTNQANAGALLDKVVAAYKHDPIYYFSRAQLAHASHHWDDAIAYLNKGQVNDPAPEDWWYERRSVIRDLLAAGDPKRAYVVASGYTSGPEGRLVEARFQSGWIALSFLKDPKTAVKQFEAMAKLSTLDDSVSQAQYWLGRAQAAAGNAAGAKPAYTTAAGYGTIYYGLLARAALGEQVVQLHDQPETGPSEAVFQARPLVLAINLLMSNGKNDMASVLLRTLAPTLKSGGELVLAARLAQKIDAHHLAITIADIADKRGVPLDLFSFPKDGLPTTKLADIDMAAIYAITRTESRFQVDAVSSSGARGLMQLMPATAEETARKLGVAYSVRRLTSDPEYNALLGSSYLAAQLQAYNGSLVLAAAAYNAGGGNANKWISTFGDPRLASVDPVLWIELIPVEETRHYVQRVLGNYLVYRARLGQPPLDPVAALHSIAG